MQEYKNLVIIGTSHISIQSIKEVSNFIEKSKPEIIALELDKKRFFALTQERKHNFKDMLEVGLKGYTINLIGSYIEKKLGKLVGVKPGSEMIKAIELAKKHNLAIALIDQDIQITLKKLTKISFKEKFRIFKDIIRGMLFKKEIVEFDLSKVPDEKLIDMLIGKVKKDYPEIYNVLIKERNELMAKALNKIISLNKDKKILAIIGAGHEKEVVRIIRALDIN
ncbi:MAG: TraB/GumN family protein [Nanoarchaeota archaeon]